MQPLDTARRVKEASFQQRPELSDDHTSKLRSAKNGQGVLLFLYTAIPVLEYVEELRPKHFQLLFSVIPIAIEAITVLALRRGGHAMISHQLHTLMDLNHVQQFFQILAMHLIVQRQLKVDARLNECAHQERLQK